jgi:hypothetical protein
MGREGGTWLFFFFASGSICSWFFTLILKRIIKCQKILIKYAAHTSWCSMCCQICFTKNRYLLSMCKKENIVLNIRSS